jgi:hypothetical protein
MSRRARTKAELLKSIHESRALMEKKYAGLSPEQMIWPGSMGDWSVKDILAHLVDWEGRLISWYRAGLRGEIPETPAPGITWRQLPKLNQDGYEQHKDDSLEEVLDQSNRSFEEVLALVESMNEREIFETGIYPWTGESALLSWIAANTASHYNWAQRNIRTTVIRRGCPD